MSPAGLVSLALISFGMRGAPPTSQDAIFPGFQSRPVAVSYGIQLVYTSCQHTGPVFWRACSAPCCARIVSVGKETGCKIIVIILAWIHFAILPCSRSCRNNLSSPNCFGEQNSLGLLQKRYRLFQASVVFNNKNE